MNARELVYLRGVFWTVDRVDGDRVRLVRGNRSVWVSLAEATSGQRPRAVIDAEEAAAWEAEAAP